MKKSLDAVTFIERCHHIAHTWDPEIGNPFPEAWSNGKSVCYSEYKSRADKKDLEFALSHETFSDLQSQQCHYCHKERSRDHRNGIDRKDNALGYTLDNCVPCCRECNYMKSSLNDTIFIDQAKKVSVFVTENSVCPVISKRCLMTVQKHAYVA
jgi:hypothetical protein